MTVAHVEQEPFLPRDIPMTARKMRALVEKLEGGEELLIRVMSTTASSYTAAWRLRETLGPEYIVSSAGPQVWARRRREGEPVQGRGHEDETGDYMSLVELAAAAKVSVTTVHNWINQGHLERVRFGGRSMVSREQVAGWLARRAEDLLRAGMHTHRGGL